jgi:hypothetical protein
MIFHNCAERKRNIVALVLTDTATSLWKLTGLRTVGHRALFRVTDLHEFRSWTVSIYQRHTHGHHIAARRLSKGKLDASETSSPLQKKCLIAPTNLKMSIPKEMKAVYYTVSPWPTRCAPTGSAQAPKTFSVTDRPVPQPNDDEVLTKIKIRFALLPS